MEDGEESQSLLCSETFSSPTPPSGDSGWNDTNGAVTWALPERGVKLEPPASDDPAKQTSSHRDYATVFSVIAGQDYKDLGRGEQPKDHLLKAALLGGLHAKSEAYLIAFEKDINSNLQAKCGLDCEKFAGNEGDRCWRMSGSNGYDGNRMTGSSAGGNKEKFSRLSDASGSQGPAQPHATPTEGMLMGRVGGVAVQDVGTRSIVAGTVGAGPQVTIGGIFRPPQSVSDSGRSFGTAYTTTTGGASPFSPLYSSHGAGMASYSAFYSQYPGYNPNLHGNIEAPQLGSYSAVLQSMGSHAAQSQPRAMYGSGAGSAQYPLLSVTQPTTMGPGKSYLQNSAGLTSAAERDELKYRREQDIDIHRRHSTTGVIQDEKTHHFSVPSAYTEASRGVSLSSAPRESPTQKREPASGAQEFYKVPYSAREGSLKHRILRPSEPVSQSNPQHSAFINTDEPSPKRTRTETLDLSKGSLRYMSDTLGDGATDRERGSSSSGTHLHYPQHFMKGSIIQLANGDLKRVEDLETDDFVHSADISSDLKIDSCTVVHIEENRVQGTAVLGFVVGEHKVQVTVEATLEHPFFVFGRGWSSCEPQYTFRRYGLECHRLSVGDICISLTHKEVAAHAAEISQQQRQQQNKQLEGPSAYNKTVKMEDTQYPPVSSQHPPVSSPAHRNKSPGHSTLSPGAPYGPGQSYRSETGQSEAGRHPADGRRFESPASSQIPTSTTSPSQEQKSHSLGS